MRCASHDPADPFAGPRIVTRAHPEHRRSWAIAILALGLPGLLTGCHSMPRKRWTGYAVQESSEFGLLHVVGEFDTVGQCRAALLRDRDLPHNIGLVCGDQCPEPKQGEAADCGKVVVVR